MNSPKIGKLNIDTLIISQGLLIHEKNQSSKISCYCPFKQLCQDQFAYICGFSKPSLLNFLFFHETIVLLFLYP